MNDDLMILYNYIVEYKMAHDGNSPSYYDIAGALDMNTGAVYRALRLLKARGLIDFEPRKTRSIIVKGAKWIPPEMMR
ncbi:hypothetical protein D6833_13880 [Candidatus Parcubacteria bacterium]|nr:MAG: hypothetical protein D6833_13880 [Candidatus Parcubacteria bacterium]